MLTVIAVEIRVISTEVKSGRQLDKE